MPRYLGPCCADCGALHAVTNTSYTRVSLAGWRAVRRRSRDGSGGGSGIAIEWRCPSCWTDWRANRGLSVDVSVGIGADSLG